MNPQPQKPKHDETFERLITHYIGSFPDKLGALTRTMAAGRAGDHEGLAEAREIAHRMHGTAGCYGLRELSDAAAVLDELLTSMKRGNGGTWDDADAAAAIVRSLAEAATKR